MAWVQKWLAKCDDCGHEWLPKNPEVYGDPKQCGKCKSREWNRTVTGGLGKVGGVGSKAGVQGVRGGVSDGPGLEQGGVDGDAKVRRPLNAARIHDGAVDRSAQADTGGERKVKSGDKGKLTPEQFFAMNNSDRLRATREGRYP